MKKIIFGSLISSIFSFTAFANCPNVQYRNMKCVDQVSGEESYMDLFQLNNNMLTISEDGDKSSQLIPANKSSDGVKHQAKCEEDKLVETQIIEQTGGVATSKITFLSNGFEITGQGVIWDCIQSSSNDCDSDNAVWTTSIAENHVICTVQ